MEQQLVEYREWIRWLGHNTHQIQRWVGGRARIEEYQQPHHLICRTLTREERIEVGECIGITVAGEIRKRHHVPLVEDRNNKKGIQKKD